MKTKILKIVLFFILIHNVSSQIKDESVRFSDLSKIEPSWTQVQGGKATSVPLETSYGFVIPNDGRLICSFSKNGVALWSKAVKGKPSNYLATYNDFIIAITESKKLNLINPSGLTLWTSDCEFEITENPFIGQDFRIIVKGSNKLACYGLDGKRKWLLNTDKLSTLPLCELNDGTLLVFLKAEKQSKTQAIRISVFGEILEGITFAGKIIDASSGKNGVNLLFYNNSAGLCAVEDEKAASLWVINNLKSTDTSSRIISQKNSNISCIKTNASTGTNIFIINTQTGTILHSIHNKDISSSNIKQFTFSNEGFFICDNKNAFEYSLDGKCLWQAKLLANDKWSHIFYTKDNYLLISMNNWAINCFLMNQNVNKKNTATKEEKIKYFEETTSSSEMDDIGLRILNDEKIEAMQKGFTNGDYSLEEKKWLMELNAELSNYVNSSYMQKKSGRAGKSFFADNPVYTQSLINLASSTGTDNFTEKLAQLTKNETQTVMSLSLVRSCGKHAYDPNGEILNALQSVVHSLAKNDVTTAKAICDSTYEICRFMGRPALYKQGKEILTQFLYPQFDKTIRDYARTTLQKIIKLEL